jgi:hypothetical protein
MPRNMSFAMTTDQFKARTKTQTRRFGWWFLKPGDVLNGVEKSMGLKKGEKIKRLGQIRVVSTRPELLSDISPADVVAEGFPDWHPTNFINLMVAHYGVHPRSKLNVIEFEYIHEN